MNVNAKRYGTAEQPYCSCIFVSGCFAVCEGNSCLEGPNLHILCRPQVFCIWLK